MAKKAKKLVKKAAKKVAKKTTKKVTKKASKKASKKVAPKPTTKKTKKESAAVVKAPTLQIGDTAPSFSLPDQDGKMISLSDFRGKNVVVYFYPKAMTPGCTVQACGLRDTEKELADANIVVLGISADPVRKLKQFQEKYNLNFKLLSDETKKVIEAYGSWGLKKFMGREFMGILRQSFFINGEGKIVHVMHKVETKSHHDDVLKVFKNLLK